MLFSRLRHESSPPPFSSKEEEIRMNSDESRENRAEFESENERHFRWKWGEDSSKGENDFVRDISRR